MQGLGVSNKEKTIFYLCIRLRIFTGKSLYALFVTNLRVNNIYKGIRFIKMFKYTAAFILPAGHLYAFFE